MNEQSPTQDEEHYVFVSYDKADASKVREEVAWMQSEGISFRYNETVAAGEEDLSDALKNAVRLVFYVSDASMASDACRREVALASLRGLEVVQVFLDEGGLTEDIRDNHHLGRVFQADGDATHRVELARALKEPLPDE